MTEITTKRMQELETKPEFISDLKKATSVLEISQVVKKYGIDLSEEELNEGCAQAKVILENQGYVESDELSDNALDMVSGGLNVPVYMLGLLMAAGIAITPALWLGGLAVMCLGLVLPSGRKKK